MDKIIVGNWKMYPTLSDSSVLTSSLHNSLETIHGAEVIIAPPTVWLMHVIENWKHRVSHVKFAAQNIWPDDQGAFTGETSAYLLKDIVSHVIIGHSERRRYQLEDNDLIREKVQACLKWHIKPILCVGETKKVLNGDKVDTHQWEKLAEQLEEGLSGVSKAALENVLIAYEPVWAIGTQNPATPEYTVEVIKRMREILAKKYSQEAAETVPILYGGSVSAGNCSDFLRETEIAGLLIGGVSVKAKEFSEICQIASRVGR
ncbi:MAG TPA: triose-phosphate isomerase [Candidatus Saccharimonadales bacterium]|nr:triose-phosphate isomerase [Candidatus Saccharimonadales bacterium]